MPSLETKTQRLQPCSQCGAQVVGGTAGCALLFKELLSLDFFGEPDRRMHHLVHNAYVLQHPKGRSNRSVAIHLTSLCWLVERGGQPGWDLLPSAVLARLSSDDGLPWLEPPSIDGQLTLMHVWGHRPEEYADRVEAWAKSVWRAWNPHHARAVAWLNGKGH
ncbi:MAG: DUF5946 family protein [Anaerolineales bacterium]|jgi:hypothetical protein